MQGALFPLAKGYNTAPVSRLSAQCFEQAGIADLGLLAWLYVQQGTAM
ncbi:hypothetical protein [Endozoicomonas sp. SCSIO W0465]|nr:hypothetical protein [Endozoicomonas sp. SCSIO W0465]USE35614.1 hypothetical protein MJO57_26590 [Endozoicomonas sp. SCSIO W0465]